MDATADRQAAGVSVRGDPLNRKQKTDNFERKVTARQSRNHKGTPIAIFGTSTNKGEAELKKAWPVYRSLIVNLFGRHFREEELDFLAQCFAKVTENLANPFVV